MLELPSVYHTLMQVGEIPTGEAMSRPGSRAAMEQLIQEVRKYPCLYNTSLEGYRDVHWKDSCWEEIAKNLGWECECFSDMIFSLMQMMLIYNL